MRALVLFTGTGSVDRALESYGFQVDNLDIDPKCNATWTCDILQWEAWKELPPGHYDFIWASPPCTEYSIARTTAKTPRNFELADGIVLRTLHIIQELAPRAWMLENPLTGSLKSRPFMQGYPFRDVCYCRYAEGNRWNYKKATRLWGVLPSFAPRPMCTRRDPCELSAATGRHPETAQRINLGRGKNHSLNELYSIPRLLCLEVARAAMEACADL